jgi:hypothetical protein
LARSAESNRSGTRQNQEPRHARGDHEVALGRGCSQQGDGKNWQGENGHDALSAVRCGKSRPGVTSVRSRRIIDSPAAGRKQQGPRVGLRTDRELLTRYSALGGVPGGSPNLRPLQAESWQARLLPSGSARSWFPVSRFAMNQSAGPRHTLPPGMAAVLY